MSHRKAKAAKKGKEVTTSMAATSKSTVSQFDLHSRGDTPQTKGISYSTIKHNTTVTTDSANEGEQRRVL